MKTFISTLAVVATLAGPAAAAMEPIIRDKYVSDLELAINTCNSVKTFLGDDAEDELASIQAQSRKLIAFLDTEVAHMPKRQAARYQTAVKAFEMLCE